MSSISIIGYNKLVRATLVVIYLVIVAGGIVRCTGSGMGCPDWPKCFGRWVPPTNVSELPLNYKVIYSSLGYHTTEFNPQKTWTEYLNRLLGALSGLFVLGSFVYSFRVSSSFKIRLVAFLTLVTILFQGWLGAKVVDSNLAPYMITIHMFFALVIVSLLIYSLVYSGENKIKLSYKSGRIYALSILVLAFTLGQILLGTQVRMQVDQISTLLNFEGREYWIDRLGLRFYVHRSFSIVILLLNVYFYWLVKDASDNYLKFWSGICLALIFFIIATGVVLNYFGLPSWVQPIHLSVSSIIFGVQFYLFVHLHRTNTEFKSLVANG